MSLCDFVSSIWITWFSDPLFFLLFLLNPILIKKLLNEKKLMDHFWIYPIWLFTTLFIPHLFNFNACTFFLSLYVVFFLYYIFFTFFYSFYIFFSFYVSCVLSFYVVFFLCIYTYMDIICTIIIIWYINKNFVKFILHTTCIINKIQFSLNKVESSFDKKKIPKTQEYLKSYKFFYLQSV